MAHHSLGQELRTLADQIRVKMHLAGMEAKDVWSKLEPRVREFENKAEKATELIADELTQMGTDLKEQLHKLNERLSEKK